MRRTVVPRRFAFALAAALAVAAPRPVEAFEDGPAVLYSPRLGIHYRLVPVGGRFAAKLTADPVPGSPLSQSQVQLERGDAITYLDGVAIRGAADVEAHFGATTVKFINVRKPGEPVTLMVYLPPMAAPGVPEPNAPEEDFGVAYVGEYSPRLGIFFEMAPLNGSLGARLTAPPVPGSPLAQEQIGLKAGDVIHQLDGVAVTTAAELERHVGQTAVAYFDGGARPANRWVFLTPLEAPGVPRPISTTVLPSLAPVPESIPAIFPLSRRRRAGR